jgi:hypothetical protein
MRLVVKPKENPEMNDYRFVAARRLVWNKDAWREPALLALAIRALNQLVAGESGSPESLAEAEMLIKKLYIAGKKPPMAM